MFPPLTCPCAYRAIPSPVGVHRVLECPVTWDRAPGHHPPALPTIPGEARGRRTRPALA
jgi:hypothetical protein